ncbi:hypothetical protein F4680DRAFT_415806, partial [Xylaria scruposa]
MHSDDHRRNVSIAGYTNTQKIKSLQAAYDSIVKTGKTPRAQISRQKGVPQNNEPTRKKKLIKTEKKLIPLLVIARQPTDSFKRRLIKYKPRKTNIRRINYPIKPGRGQTACKSLAARVHDYINIYHQQLRL